MTFKISRKQWMVFFGLTLLIGFIFMRGEMRNVYNVLKNVKLEWFLIGFACMSVYWLVEAKTLHLMLRSYENDFSYLKVLKLVLATQFFNGVTPFSSGGQPFQIYILSKDSDLSVSRITSAALHNFIMYQSVLVLLGIGAYTLERIYHVFPEGVNHLSTLALIGVFLNIGVILGLLMIAFSPQGVKNIMAVIYGIMRFTPFKKKIPKMMARMDQTIETFTRDNLVLLKKWTSYVAAFFLNILKLLAFYSIAFCIFKAVGFNQILLYQTIIASAYIMLLTSLVPVPGASGGAEVSFLMFFSAFHIGAIATTVMLLWRFITYYSGLIIGFITVSLGYGQKQLNN